MARVAPINNRPIAPEIVPAPVEGDGKLHYEWTNVKWTAFINTRHGRVNVESHVELPAIVKTARRMGRELVYVSV